ncbi:hypothetical protein DFQ28_005087 [Apophysomyces sp. BC1034]|nr:hypothetical protein DFQ30_010428 [Apophysomyces sp. BC1015]KAG0181841.1 hypothetical protein DFQ29_006767 [Apophysomyces sp. BC1021]KAG0193483.1 hypothetical protein DFQ28_005087 [Apophysomyces sp. BC1034]
MVKGSRGRSGRGRGGANRGRGGANRGRGNRGHHRGGGGGGPRRQLRPSTIGYVYEPENYSDSDLLEDFRLYGQFDDSSDSSDDDWKKSKKSGKKKKQQQQQKHTATKINNEAFLDDDDAAFLEQRPGLGLIGKPKGRATAATFKHHAAVDFVESISQTSDESPKLANKDEGPAQIKQVEDQLKQASVDLGEGTVPFYFDSTPSQLKTEVKKPVVAKRQKKSKKEKKIVRGDDLYLSGDSISEGDNDDDEHMAILRDYMENTSLDEIDRLRLLASRLDPDEDDSAYDYGLLPEDDSEEDDMEHEERMLEYGSDDDDEDYEEFYSNAKDLQDVSPNAFASTAKNWQEFSSSALENDSPNTGDWSEVRVSPFQRSLEDALAQVPPGLQAGLRGKLAYEKKMEKQRHRMQVKEKKLAKEGKERKDGSHLEMRKIDGRIRDFIKDDSLSSYQFLPMSKHNRRQVHLLARAYNLKSSSIGTGAHRTPILSKTDRTFMPTDRRYIDRFIEEAQTTINAKYNIASRKAFRPEPVFAKGKKNNGPKNSGPKNSGPRNSGPKNKNNTDTGPVHGTVVGSGVAPIGESNVGHRMLAAMGWRQGDALGANNEGITAPVEAVIRKKRRGLGS